MLNRYQFSRFSINKYSQMSFLHCVTCEGIIAIIKMDIAIFIQLTLQSLEIDTLHTRAISSKMTVFPLLHVKICTIIHKMLASINCSYGARDSWMIIGSNSSSEHIHLKSMI